MLSLGQKIQNNFLSNNLNTNSKNTTSASPLVTRRVRNQRIAFTILSPPLCGLINKFSAIKTKY